MNIEELKRLAEANYGWRNASSAWPHKSGDGAAVVGNVDDSHEPAIRNPVAAVDVTQYDGFQDDSMQLAQFYAAANPAAVLELIAEVEYLRGKNREHFDACIGCDEELKRVTKQRDELLAALKDARDSIADWGEYVPVYFQEKHGLVKELYDLDELINKAEG